MKKTTLILLGIMISIVSYSQIDTVTLNSLAVHMFPSFPVKSSYTSIFDKRIGQNFVYSANMESGLGIYDVSVPNNINLVLDMNISTFNNLDVSTVEQLGNSLYLGIGDFQNNSNSSSGLSIVDITNPIIPIVKNTWDSTIFDHGISHLLIEGNYAYLSTMTDGIIILDISNEYNIVFKSHLQLDLNFPAPSTNAHNSRGLKYKNDSLYVCFDRGGLRVIDVTNKSNPLEVYKYINNTLNSQAAAAYNDITIKGNYAFVSVDYCGLEILGIGSIPFTLVQWFNPWNCSNTNWSGAEIHTNEVMLANGDSLLFITAGQSELLVFDVTNPLSTIKIGEFVNLYDTLATHGLDVRNNKIILSFIHTPFHIPPFTPFFADPGGLKLLDYNITNSSTSVVEITESGESVIIYPNPNNGNIFSLKSNVEIEQVSVFNSLGQLVFIDSDINTVEYTLDLISREKGFYFLSIKSKSGQLNKKVVVN